MKTWVPMAERELGTGSSGESWGAVRPWDRGRPQECRSVIHLTHLVLCIAQSVFCGSQGTLSEPLVLMAVDGPSRTSLRKSLTSSAPGASKCSVPSCQTHLMFAS